MILLDSSILVEFLRRQNPGIKRVLASGDAVISGVTRAEILHGVKDAVDRSRLITFLDELATVPTPEGVWDALGDNLAILRRAGVNVPFPDALIATIALLQDVPLWSLDAHYGLMKPNLPRLKLFSGSTS
jgi:predicted nucleic acid-binding protein